MVNAEVRSAYPAAADGLDVGEADGDAALRDSEEPVVWSPDGADGLDADAPGADAPGADGVGADDGALAPYDDVAPD